MKAWAWCAARYESGSIVKIMREDGVLVNAFECKYVSTGVKSNIGKWAKDCDVEWLNTPWSNSDFLNAMKNYELNHFIRFDCREDLR